MTAKVITPLLRLRKPTHPYIVVMTLAVIMGWGAVIMRWETVIMGCAAVLKAP